MHRRFRTSLFIFFVFLFLIGAPIVVLYTAGYRYNPNNGQVVQTGVLSISSTPRGARISLNGEPTNKTTPVIFNRLMPGTYAVRLLDDERHAYETIVTVVSGQTRYISDVVLFPRSEPEIVISGRMNASALSPDNGSIALLAAQDGGQDLWRYDIDRKTTTLLVDDLSEERAELLWSPNSAVILLKTPKKILAFNAQDGRKVAPPSLTRIDNVMTLVTNSEAVEVHDERRGDDRVIALLPRAAYDIVNQDGPFVILKTPERVLLLNLDAANPILLNARGNIAHWSDVAQSLVWSDGSELSFFATETSATTFVTRQSTPFQGVGMLPNGFGVLVCTASDILVFSLGTDDRLNGITLTSGETLQNCMIDSAGRNTYVVGTFATEPGLYRISLR